MADLTLRFLLASLGCLVSGLGVWALSALLRRYWPALAMQRSIWLFGQLTVAATFVLVLLPQQERVRLLPQIEAATESMSRYIAPPPVAAPTLRAAPPTQPAPDGAHGWLSAAAQCWLALYLFGLLHAAGAVWRAQRMLGRLAALGHPQRPAGGAAIIEVDAPISPMLLGLFKPRLLLPRHLRSFAPAQQQLIIEHELTHLRRHDLQLMTAGVLLQTLLWFNPFMRLLRASLGWAQELGCDRDVLQGRPAAQRKAYAAALLAQLKLQHCAPGTALAFGGVDPASMKERVALIRSPGSGAGAWRVRLATIGVLGAMAAANAALQPALAWHVGPETPAYGSLHCTAFSDAASGKRLLRQGLCNVRVTPASTFNIPVSLMGFDSGYLVDEHTPRLPFKEGYADWVPAWRAPMDPADWIKTSAVWYAQQVTAHIGPARFQRYLHDFGYGNGDASEPDGVARAWISSTLAISPDEQIDFLRRIVKRELPVSAKAYEMTNRIFKVASLPGGWEVYGKTGTANPAGADGKEDTAHSFGWFVGWATKGERSIVFAHLVQDRQETAGAAGPRAREAFLRQLPAQLDSL